MNNKYFEIGKCSKKYIYIFITALMFILKNCIISIGELSIQTQKNIFGIEVVLRNHPLMKLLLEYIGYIIFSIIFKFAFKNKSFNNSSNSITKKKTTTMDFILDNFQTLKLLLITCCFFAIQLIVRSILNSCGVWMLDMWIFNIIFIYIFIKYFLHKETYKHQFISLVSIFSINLIILIIASSINFNNGSDYDIVNDLYGNYLYVVLFYIIFIILSALLSSSQVMQKKLMEICYISPLTILLLIGIFSALFAIITIIITTNVSCNESLSKNKLCPVSHLDYNENYYFDNFSIFLINLGEQFNNNKTSFFLEIFLVYPLYAFICFLKYFYETLVVLYLNPYYVLLSDEIFYCVKKIVSLSYNNKDIKTYLKLFGEIVAIIGYCFYLEIFIIKCWGLNANTRNSIARRSMVDFQDNQQESDEDSSEDSDKDNNKDINEEKKITHKDIETELINMPNQE